jgi:hypothetical protein
MIQRALLAAMIAVMAIFASPAQAQTLLAATGSNGVDGQLFRVNPATGASTLVGNILAGGLPIGVTGLAANPATGVVFGVTAGLTPNFGNSLFTLNVATGVATIIGGGGTLSQQFGDIAFSPAGTLYGYNRNTNSLYTINTATGVNTLVGPTGLATNCGASITFDGGTLRATISSDSGTIDTINPATGAGTAGPALTGAPAGFACINATAAQAGTVFGVDSDTAGVASTTLVRINPATGAITNVGALPNDTDALVFAAFGAGGLQAPTLSEWSLLLLALMIAGVGMHMARRRS